MKKMPAVLGLLPVAVLLVFFGFPQPTASAVDATPPTGTIVINDNHTATKTTNVTLTLTWNDPDGVSDVSRMRFSNDGATWFAWQVLSATLPYAMLGGDGYKTVRIQYMDKAQNHSAVFSDYIRLDTVAPTGTIIINSGAATTNTQKVTLALTWADTGSGVTRMRFSDNGSTWTAWESQKATRAYTLPSGFGNHTVRVQYSDAAENYSPVYSDYIKLVEPAPGTTDTVILPGNVQLAMKWVPSGTFTMGSPVTEQDRVANEQPLHSVTVPGFWMGKCSVTKRQWTAVKGTTPWAGQDFVLANLDSPAVYMTWNDAKAFVAALNTYTGKAYRLPSEAEREYATRAGTSTRFYWGDDLSGWSVGDYAWYVQNAWLAGEQYAHVVDQKLPNAWNLYDLSGNVFEWCEDDYHASYTGAPTGGQAWVDTPRAANRVARGGSWYQSYDWTRSADRINPAPDVFDAQYGFRVVRTP